MSIFSIAYKVLNKETGRKITKTKYRLQIRTKTLKINKLFDTEEEAKDYEKDAIYKHNSLDVIDKIISDTNAIDIRNLLKKHFTDTLTKQSPTSFKTNQNRCLSAIPGVKIKYTLIQKTINNYKFKKHFVDLMINRQFDYANDGIDFGDFFIETVDFHLIIAYIQVRKDKGIKDNTILRELSTISTAYDKIYKYYPNEFKNGILNPIKQLPKSEKPKPYLERKRVLSDDESRKIAEYLKTKENQEPFYVFIECLFCGARKSEVLGIEWENINFENNTIFLPKTKNGRSRIIDIEEMFLTYLKNNKKDYGKVFKLTHWNFRQYWVDALKALGMYKTGDRLHFHDTRRTAITKNIKSINNSSFQLAKVFGVAPSFIEQEKLKLVNNIDLIINKLRNGGKLTENEIMILAGHSDIKMTQIYNADR